MCKFTIYTLVTLGTVLEMQFQFLQPNNCFHDHYIINPELGDILISTIQKSCVRLELITINYFNQKITRQVPI